MSESDLRYTFSCPTCAESLSIPLAKIPPVQARFGCPKCGKQMDFPSREEARVYAMLQSGEVAAAEPEAAGSAPAEKTPATPPDAPTAEKLYRVEKKGFENDVYDRRGMRNLIRTNGLIEADSVRLGDDAPRRAADFPELKSLFELRKTARAVPPDRLPQAHRPDRVLHLQGHGPPPVRNLRRRTQVRGHVRAGLRALRGHRQRGPRRVLTLRASSAILRLPERE